MVTTASTTARPSPPIPFSTSVQRGDAVRLLGAALLALVVAGYLTAAAVWLNMRIAEQVAVTGHRLAVSDLFPRWYGVRAMLDGQSPYGEAFEEALQRAYYGAPMAVELQDTLLGSRLGFFYPPYVAVPLAPLAWLPFDAVRWLAVAGLGAAVVAAVLLWVRTLGYAPSRREHVALGALALAFYPTLDLMSLQQLSGLVLLYLVGAYALAARGRYGWAGILLALATIKPQIMVVPAAGLLCWSLWRRERWDLSAAFGATMLAQLALSELLVPGWFGQFVDASVRYRAHNSVVFWLPGIVAGGPGSGDAAPAIVAALPLPLLAWLWWRVRLAPAGSPAFLRIAALGFAVGVAIAPADAGLYNRALLLVPVLTVWADGQMMRDVRRRTKDEGRRTNSQERNRPESGENPLKQSQGGTRRPVPFALCTLHFALGLGRPSSVVRQGVFGRAAARVLALALATPVVLMAVIGWHVWLGASSPAVAPLANVASALFIVLPVVVLPAATAQCLGATSKYAPHAVAPADPDS